MFSSAARNVWGIFAQTFRPRIHSVQSMHLPFEVSQRPVLIGDHVEQWRIRKSGLTFTRARDDLSLETGNAQAAVAFFAGGRTEQDVLDAAQQLVGTVDEALGGWPARD